MKVFCCWAFVLAFVFALTLPATEEWRSKLSKGKVVLRLSYRGLKQSKNYLKRPYSIGMFEEGERRAFYYGELMGTDWKGNIYIFDPIDKNLCVLKRFDKQGVFREAWEPIRTKCGSGVGVTKDGYIWTGLGWVVDDRPNGWPIVVYRSGTKKPVMDWRYKLPESIYEKIHAFLKESGFEWKKWEELPYYDFATNDWHFGFIGPGYSYDKVALRLLSPFLGHENQIARVLWVLISSDGRHLFDIQLAVRLLPYLAPDGTIWIDDSDFNPQNWEWSRVWWWKKGEEKGEPLVDLTKEPWKSIWSRKRLLIGPVILMDAVGNMYVFLERYPLKPRERKIFVEGMTIIFSPPTYGGELALVVLNSKRQMLTYLPWQHAFVSQSIPRRWVVPLPDGSGFYRMEYQEREAVIYFHPLPK